jgi:hypothetical protein
MKCPTFILLIQAHFHRSETFAFASPSLPFQRDIVMHSTVGIADTIFLQESEMIL